MTIPLSTSAINSRDLPKIEGVFVAVEGVQSFNLSLGEVTIPNDFFHCNRRLRREPPISVPINPNDGVSVIVREARLWLGMSKSFKLFLRVPVIWLDLSLGRPGHAMFDPFTSPFGVDLPTGPLCT